MLQLYKNIRQRRLELGMTQDELAKKVGYTGKSMIAKIENGEVDLSQSKVLAFADALDIKPGDLMGHDGYYTDPETAAAAQEMFENPDLRMLFDAEKDIAPEDLKAVYAMVMALKRKEDDTDE